MTANGKNKAVVPILLRKEEKDIQCMAAVYRSSKGGDKVRRRLVKRSLEGDGDYCYYMCHCNNIEYKGNPASFKCTKPASFTYLFPCSLDGECDQLQLCLSFIKERFNLVKAES